LNTTYPVPVGIPYNTSPAVFSLLSSSGTVGTRRPTFDWSDSSAGADDGSYGDWLKYDILYSTSAAWTTTTSSIGLVVSNFTPSSNLNNFTTYFWKVNAYDSYAATTTSTEWWLYVTSNSAPTPFSLTTPTNGQTVTTRKPEFDWSDSTEPDGDSVMYEFRHSTASGFSVYTASSGLISSAFTFDVNLDFFTTYYWRVYAYDSFGSTVSCLETNLWIFVEPNKISRDINGDGIPENVYDVDENTSNGYESYINQGTTATVKIDGDNDGKYDFFISTSGDSNPEIYWDPDSNIISTITVVDVNSDEILDYVYDSNGDGTNDKYYNPGNMTINSYSAIPSKTSDVNGNGNNEQALDQDGNPNNGYETFIDPDGISTAVVSIDTDGDGKIDHFIDINNDGIPDKLWDPDNNVVTVVQLQDYNGDGVSDWGIDVNGDGAYDKYYSPATRRLLNIPVINSNAGYNIGPNPFNPSEGVATIVYDLVKDGDVIIDIYNITGEKVVVLVSGYRTKGRHQVKWNGGNGEFDTQDGGIAWSGNKIAMGIYIIRYKLPDRTEYKKIAIIK